MYQEGDWTEFFGTSDKGIESLAGDLNQIGLTSYCDSVKELAKVWMMADVNIISPILAEWASGNDLFQAVRSAALARIENIKIISKHKKFLDWPEWLRLEGDYLELGIPGLVPIPLDPQKAQQAVIWIQEKMNIRVANYHFNFCQSYIEPRWENTIAMPIHKEVNPDDLDRVLSKLSEA